jgi:hypothetical protein
MEGQQSVPKTTRIKFQDEWVRARRGERMTKGRGWMLLVTKNRKRALPATLLETVNLGGRRIAIFSVPN